MVKNKIQPKDLSATYIVVSLFGILNPELYLSWIQVLRIAGELYYLRWRYSFHTFLNYIYVVDNIGPEPSLDSGPIYA